MRTNEDQRVYMLERYHRRRKEAVAQLGGMCIQCGTPDGLEIDHVDPAQKQYDVADMSGYSDEKFWAEIAKCQLLCRSCHQRKTAKDLNWPGRLLVDCPCGLQFETPRLGKQTRKYCSTACAAKFQIRGRYKGEIRHGTPSAYSYRKCRCTICRDGNAARMRKFRAGV